jgi:ABC-type polysaccharide/polyol phosphate transport system ATPase subunit
MFSDADTVLEVQGVSKLYSRRAGATQSRLAETFGRALFSRRLNPIRTLKAGEFWGLKDVSFSLKRGEALGVIGLNGAGKTSLLRILSGQLLPDEGEIRALGRTAAMIDLTAGFSMSASGRQNIRLRGVMLGRSRDEIEGSVDEIIEFSELEDAIDAPVESYSSGMLMRLAFSIMVAMEPDLLYIDEILSVGDFRFRQKCLARMRELRARAAFVLVSHSLGDIQQFCGRAIILHEGRVVFDGEPDEAISVYQELRFPQAQSLEERRSEILKPQFHNPSAVNAVEHYWSDASGREISEIQSGEDLFFCARFDIAHQPRNLIMGVPVWREDGEYITGFSTEVANERLTAEPDRRNEFVLEVPQIAFNPGAYISNFTILDGPEFLYRAQNAPLHILPSRQRYWGAVSLPHRWRQQNASSTRKSA